MAELESKLTEIQAQAERLENDKRGLIEQKEKLEKAQSGHDEDRSTKSKQAFFYGFVCQSLSNSFQSKGTEAFQIHVSE